MESDRKLKLGELRQKRLAYYQRNYVQKGEEIDKPISSGLAKRTEEKWTDNHNKTKLYSDAGNLSPRNLGTHADFIEKPITQANNLTHSLKFDQDELIIRCFDEQNNHVSKSNDFSTSRCDDSYREANWFRHTKKINFVNSSFNDDTSVCSLNQPWSEDSIMQQSASYVPVHKSISQPEIQTKIKVNNDARQSLGDNISPHRKTNTRKQKDRNKRSKKNSNGKNHSKVSIELIDKAPSSPTLPENFFDLDSLQKAARDGDDVLRNYIKELSTKMVDSKTGRKMVTLYTDTENYMFSQSQKALHSNSFHSEAIIPQDSSSLDEYFVQTNRQSEFDPPTTSHDYCNRDSMPTSDDQFVQYKKSSLEFEDQNSKYVPKISRPAIESSQLQKWGLYDDLEGSSIEENEDLHQNFGSVNQDDYDFDLMTHRPSNRSFSPLIQSASSHKDIYEMTPDSPVFQEFELTTHRPINTDNKFFERVNTFSKENLPRPSESDQYSSRNGHYSVSNDIQEFFKSQNDNIQATSPDEHMLGVMKHHKIEKRRRKSKKKSITDSSKHSPPTFNYEELGDGEKKFYGYRKHWETKPDKITGWSSNKEDEPDSKFQVDVLSMSRYDKGYKENSSLNTTPELEAMTSKLDAELKLSLDTGKQDSVFESDDEEVNSKPNLDSRIPTIQGNISNFYDQQFSSLPLSKSPEPRVSTNAGSKSSQLENFKGNLEDLLLTTEVRKPLGMKLNLSLDEDDDDFQPETYSPKTPLLKNILESENKNQPNLEVNDEKNRSKSMNSRKKIANRLLDRGQSHKQKWATSSSLPNSLLTRKSSQFSSSLKDCKRNNTGSSLRSSSKYVNGFKEFKGCGNSLEIRSQADKFKKRVTNGKFFTVTSANITTEFNNANSQFQQKDIPPLTLQLLSDSPRGGEGLSIWQLLPDELLFYIFSYLSTSSLAVAAQVCQTFHRIANDELLWKSITLEKKDLTDDCLIQIGGKHPTDISFLQCNGAKVSENGLRAMFRGCAKSLKKLNVSGSTGGELIGDSILLHASRCPRLTSLDLSWCSVTNNGLNSIAESIEMLQVLCLNGCQAITDDSINMILQKHCKNIVVLELFGCFNISPVIMSQIGQLCRNLHTLNVGQCYKMTDDHMSSLVSHLERVEHLDMRGCKQMHDTTVRKLVRCCKNLKSLSLANCGHLTDASIVEISTYLATVRNIDVSGCKKITNQGVYSLAKSCYQLTTLDLSSTSVNYKSVSSLSSYCGNSLESLKLNFCKDITEKSVLKLLQNCQKLQMLQLYGVKGLRNLASIKNQFPALKFD